MSLFSWFSSKPAPVKVQPAVEPSGLLDADATVPLQIGRQGKPLVPSVAPEHAANSKNERMERRELLYTVVRDAMVCAGVLSASYKFKVLSLDQRGRQFLVMMDLAREYGGETVRLSEIEVLIAQTAKTRFDILVTSVYWRINDHVTVGLPQKGIIPQGAALPAQAPAAAAAVRRPPIGTSAVPVPAAASVPSPASSRLPPIRPAVPVPSAAPLRPVARAPVPAEAARTPSVVPPPAADAAQRQPVRYEPIDADEVAAFKRALANVSGPSVVPAAADKPGVPVRSGPLLPPAPASSYTGFEDTEMPAPDLSTTQYGELN